MAYKMFTSNKLNLKIEEITDDLFKDKKKELVDLFLSLSIKTKNEKNEEIIEF